MDNSYITISLLCGNASWSLGLWGILNSAPLFQTDERLLLNILRMCSWGLGRWFWRKLLVYRCWTSLLLNIGNILPFSLRADADRGDFQLMLDQPLLPSGCLVGVIKTLTELWIPFVSTPVMPIKVNHKTNHSAKNNMITKGTNRSISTNKVVSRRKMPLLDANWGFDDLADYGFLSRVLPTDPMKVTAGK